jgi:CheY-like chemotaxis protein
VIVLRFAVPDIGTIEVQGVVAWVRHASSGGKPQGMGVQFENLDAHHGAVIDRIVGNFRGLRVVVLSASIVTRSLIGRTVRSLMSNADIREAQSHEEIEVLLKAEPDVLVIDLDDGEADGLLALRLAKSTVSRPLPVIVAARDGEVRVRARSLGADEILPTPVVMSELQAAVLRAVGRPLRVT